MQVTTRAMYIQSVLKLSIYLAIKSVCIRYSQVKMSSTGCI